MKSQCYLGGKLKLKLKVNFSLLVSCCAIFLAFGSSIARAGTELTYQNQSNHNYVIAFSESKVGSTDGVYDLSSDVFLAFRHNAKTFSKVGRQEVVNVVKTAQQALASVSQMSAYLPPEYRQQLEQPPSGFAQLGNVAFRVVGVDKVAGYQCQRVAIERNAQVEGEVCLAPPALLNIPAKDIKGLEVAFDRVSSSLGRLDPQLASQANMATFKQRIPLRWAGKDGVTWSLTSVKAVNDVGAVPTGYDEVPFDLSSIR